MGTEFSACAEGMIINLVFYAQSAMAVISGRAGGTK